MSAAPFPPGIAAQLSLALTVIEPFMAERTDVCIAGAPELIAHLKGDAANLWEERGVIGIETDDLTLAGTFEGVLVFETGRPVEGLGLLMVASFDLIGGVFQKGARWGSVHYSSEGPIIHPDSV